ncbi:DCC1-like thiol-disulfide oxidoreductase family protein [Halosegnis marinus]|uniref:DCC1-like thiol-disulfide oxidoreductase family protein n=1 Tax=Halosegnis marinus TaxID=3034023 RepID=A0ABD5ZN99_9EURY|nr:DCC1-like thiol-disulfide oxidoreductase family protein [Halosegnis sp. DT85]
MPETFVYDDECGFCTWCAQQLVDHSDLDVVGFSDLTDAERERLPEDWEEGAHLVTDDRVYSFGEAIEQAFARSEVAPPGTDDTVGFLRQFADYNRLREKLYREAADRRDVWGHFVRQDDPVRRSES